MRVARHRRDHDASKETMRAPDSHPRHPRAPRRLVTAALVLLAALLALWACAPSGPAAGDRERRGDAQAGARASEPPGPEDARVEHASSRFGAGGGAGRGRASSRFEGVAAGSGDRPPDAGPGDSSSRLPSIAGDPDAEALSSRAKDRVSLITSGFVSSAYGYSGDDPDAYLGGVMEVSIANGLLSSPGGERIKRYAAVVRGSGLRSAAELRALDVTDTDRVAGLRQVDVVAYFLTGERYAADGSVEDPTGSYRQRLLLSPYSDIYKVSYAGRIRPVERIPAQKDFHDGAGG